MKKTSHNFVSQKNMLFTSIIWFIFFAIYSKLYQQTRKRMHIFLFLLKSLKREKVFERHKFNLNEQARKIRNHFYYSLGLIQRLKKRKDWKFKRQINVFKRPLHANHATKGRRDALENDRNYKDYFLWQYLINSRGQPVLFKTYELTNS